MDEMHIGNNIIFKKLLSMKIKSILRKKFECDIDAVVDQLDVVLNDNDVRVHIDGTINMDTADLAKLIFGEA